MNRKLRRAYARSPLAVVGAFVNGLREFRLSWTTGYIGPGMDARQDAYDWGREWAHRLTSRRYEA